KGDGSLCFSEGDEVQVVDSRIEVMQLIGRFSILNGTKQMGSQNSFRAIQGLEERRQRSKNNNIGIKINDFCGFRVFFPEIREVKRLHRRVQFSNIVPFAHLIEPIDSYLMDFN